MSQQETAVSVRMQDLSPEYAEIMVLGKVLQLSGYFKDVQDQAQAVTKILFGRELGFSPIVSMSGIYIIEGKPALSANLLAATIKRSGKYDYRVTEWDNTKCVLLFRQKIDGKWEDLGPSSFDLDDAKRAGVANKGTWTKYPKAMLFARALSQGERAYCPDVSSCALYVPEELGANVNESGEVLTAQDLPKSARPVERTTEEIPIKPRAVPVAEEQPIEKPEEIGGGAAGPTAHSEAQENPASGADNAEFIDQGARIGFARYVKDLLPKTAQKDAERLKDEWLFDHGYVGTDGKPTAGAIPLLSFSAVKKAIKEDFIRMVAEKGL